MLAVVHKKHFPSQPTSSQPVGGLAPMVWLSALLIVATAVWAITTMARVMGILLKVIAQLLWAVAATGIAFLAAGLLAAAAVLLLIHR